MASEKSPYKQLGISASNTLGWGNTRGGVKQEKVGKPRFSEASIKEILKRYYYDNYSKERYYTNVTKALLKLHEESKI